MANEETIPHSPTPHEMSAHERDYDHFVAMFKWGGLISFLIGFIVVVFVLG